MTASHAGIAAAASTIAPNNHSAGDSPSIHGKQSAATSDAAITTNSTLA